jgi:acetyl-CoA/propionyl-CoA carboxylase biotin carboxyl carrier protein
VSKFVPPSGPGVRLDSGVETGSVIGGQFDSMLAKLIVHGATREEALARSRRALDEFHVEGLATVIAFHRAIVSDPAFIGDSDGFTVHTRWIETEWNNTVGPSPVGIRSRKRRHHPRQTVVVRSAVAARSVAARRPGHRKRWLARRLANVVRKSPSRASGRSTPVRRVRRCGDRPDARPWSRWPSKGSGGVGGRSRRRPRGDEDGEPVTAHKDGTITGLAVEGGAAITQGTVLAEIK